MGRAPPRVPADRRGRSSLYQLPREEEEEEEEEGFFKADAVNEEGPLQGTFTSLR